MTPRTDPQVPTSDPQVLLSVLLPRAAQEAASRSKGIAPSPSGSTATMGQLTPTRSYRQEPVQAVGHSSQTTQCVSTGACSLGGHAAAAAASLGAAGGGAGPQAAATTAGTPSKQVRVSADDVDQKRPVGVRRTSHKSSIVGARQSVLVVRRPRSLYVGSDVSGPRDVGLKALCVTAHPVIDNKPPSSWSQLQPFNKLSSSSSSQLDTVQVGLKSRVLNSFWMLHMSNAWPLRILRVAPLPTSVQ